MYIVQNQMIQIRSTYCMFLFSRSASRSHDAPGDRGRAGSYGSASPGERRSRSRSRSPLAPGGSASGAGAGVATAPYASAAPPASLANLGPRSPHSPSASPVGRSRSKSRSHSPFS